MFPFIRKLELFRIQSRCSKLQFSTEVKYPNLMFLWWLWLMTNVEGLISPITQFQNNLYTAFKCAEQFIKLVRSADAHHL